MKDKIFYLDDDLINVQLFELYFKRYFEITSSTDPKRAVQEILTDRFPLVVTDYRMPDLNADELIRQIKKDFPECIFIILSGYFEKDISYDKDAVFQFVSKPYEPESFLKVIQSALVNSTFSD